MPKKVEFKFDIDERCVTIFCENGVVVGLFYDESGNQYSVRGKNGDHWFKEKDISSGWKENSSEKIS